MIKSIHVMVVALAFLMGLSQGAMAQCESPRFLKETFNGRAQPHEILPVWQRFAAGQGQQFHKGYFEQGNQDAQFWIWLPTCSAQGGSYRFTAGVSHRPLLDATLVRLNQQGNTSLEPLLYSTNQQAFQARSEASRYLVSPVFELNPGEEAWVLIQYHSSGATFLKPEILAEVEWQEWYRQDLISSVGFYSISLTLLVFFMLFGVVAAERQVVLYGCLFLFGLLWVSSQDGIGFQVLWQGFPRWNHWASYVLLYCFAACNFVVAFMSYGKANLVSRLLLWGGIGTLLSGFAVMVLPFSLMANLGALWLLLGVVGQMAIFVGWFNGINRPGRIAVGTLVALGGVLVLLLMVNLAGVGLPDFAHQYSVHLAYCVCSLASMFLILNHVLQMRKQREAALQQALLAAQEEASLNKALAQAEQNYQRVSHLANQHQMQLATASHDIRQPLVSLRSLLVASDNLDQQVKSNLEGALDYIESLSNRYLNHSRPKQEQSTNPSEASAFPLQQVFKSVIRMFQGEADNKGIRLQSVSTSIVVQQPPLELMRVLSNLVSNALQHAAQDESQEGRILLGCRRQKQAVIIQVWDNGSGISPEQIERLYQPYQKGEQSAGEGLGLAICFQLAQQNAWQLTVHSVHKSNECTSGSGTCFSLRLPW